MLFIIIDVAATILWVRALIATCGATERHFLSNCQPSSGALP